jgi:hypothetical protein
MSLTASDLEAVKFPTKATKDPIVNRILQRFIQRSDEGMERFGVTMADNDQPTGFWIEAAQEELMDAILYLERLKQEISHG